MPDIINYLINKRLVYPIDAGTFDSYYLVLTTNVIFITMFDVEKIYICELKGKISKDEKSFIENVKLFNKFIFKSDYSRVLDKLPNEVRGPVLWNIDLFV